MSESRAPSSNGSGQVDYEAVDLPDTADEPRENWHYTQRRAELLQRVRDAGHPGALNQGELADTYGVSQQQISKDMKRIGASIRSALDDDRRALTVNSVVQRSIRGLLDEGEFYKPGTLAVEWDEWLSESGLSTGQQSSETSSVAEILSR